MIIRRMLWTLITVIAIVAGWYVYEGLWDRALFTEGCHILSASGANAWLREHPETQVLDVRSAGEFAGGALPKAVNISLGDEAFDLKVGLFDKAKPVLVYCAGGFRSRKAVARLKELGFENIQHIHRGYMSWKPDTQP
jgi:rhodanese-related sulfurtransferase